MRHEVLSTLMVSRVLFDKATELCLSNNRHVCSSGLLILQDALELVFIGVLIELRVDEAKSIDYLKFDQLMGELKSSGQKIRKSQTLKALNKDRVIVKHYGRLAEPSNVRTYLEAAKFASDDLLQNVVGKDLVGIMLHEVLKDSEAKQHILEACKKMEENEYFETLSEIRKAIFLEIEQDYSIEGWKDYKGEFGLFDFFYKGGSKAPLFTRDPDWIAKNVRDPFDYIQLDHERLRIDLMEWGISTQEFWNLYRLTPSVYRFRDTKKWEVQGTEAHLLDAASAENAEYCLDRAVSLLLKKQEHLDLARSIQTWPGNGIKVKMKIKQPVFAKATEKSNIVDTVEPGTILTFEKITSGLDNDKRFFKVHDYDLNKQPPKILSGYVPASSCEIID